MRINPIVEAALLANKPVVALESTIISHGMPYPDNVKTALECERIIKDLGCIAATIAIIEGELIIGLNESEIEYIANPKNTVVKVSRRDFPLVLARRQHGALTVSATMMACKMTNIKFFATGGIGGVHKGAESTFDISADLREFTQSEVTVFSAGAKSILDLEKTLEYLETMGVLVLGYKTDLFPAFYTRSSGIKLDYMVDEPKEIAMIILEKEKMNIKGGVLIANPIEEIYSYDKDEIDKVIEQAVEKMKVLGVKGKETTPFLLSEVAKITGNKSLFVNQQLVYNNCRLAAQTAKEYYELGDYNEKK
jgi:pseudouridine-5'-phosphate glycosidase